MPDETRSSLTGLEDLLSALHNWFVVPGEKYVMEFTISSGVLIVPFLQDGQYYRIRGSVFNDGLHRYGTQADTLTDETFTGEIAPLAVPHAVAALADKIAAWREKNPETDKTSESFGGYSYTRGGAGGSGASSSGWRAAFAGDMRRWMKPYESD